jgi:hypothetical protein
MHGMFHLKPRRYKYLEAIWRVNLFVLATTNQNSVMARTAFTTAPLFHSNLDSFIIIVDVKLAGFIPLPASDKTLLSISLLPALTSFVLQKAVWMGSPPRRLNRVLIDSNVETNSTLSWIFECLRLLIRAHLIFQLSTLLCGNSLSSRGCCSLPIRFRPKTCVSRTLNLWINIHQSHNSIRIYVGYRYSYSTARCGIQSRSGRLLELSFLTYSACAWCHGA